MTKKLLTIVLLFSSFLIFSQSPDSELKVIISGKVVDELSNQPLEYATVVVKNLKTNVVDGGITDFDGNFSIKVAKGQYDISVEFISFKTKRFLNQKVDGNLDLGIIKLAEDSKALDEVVIVAEKTTVDIRLD